MNVLSLFDGMSCGQIALEKIGIKVDNYYASEIDKYATAITKYNFPDTYHLGDIQKWQDWKLPKIDLLLAGFPCQSWSLAGKQKGINDSRGALIYNLIDIWRTYKPKYFLFENVKMKPEFMTFVNNLFGIQPIEFNSSILSAQQRKRMYWTNIPFNIPPSQEIYWCDISEKNATNVYYLTPKMEQWINKDENRKRKHKIYQLSDKVKMQMIEASHYKGISNQRNFSIQDINGRRYISVIECERLQTMKDNITQYGMFNKVKLISNTQRYKVLGNGWTVDVIAHIFKGLK